ncbi:P-loop containing nucleoside triphosphate hydrolase protein [Phaeosphaeriaceae sp. PMI808]|nr:P-loop containing nucleoside triphosphate hydrolase protein [Phaeosphaeriaceae sp. PMI808]
MTNSLFALESPTERKVMGVVEDLQSTGLRGIIKFPQLVVCGDQSSGKSAVLEALTAIEFPQKENLCTRFATEIILRRSKSPRSTVTIRPDELRPSEEQAILKEFNKSINNLDKIPDMIEEATRVMKLGSIGDVNSKAFSRDVLSIEITGPNRPQLTLVDLPGLIPTTRKGEFEADKGPIINLTKQYMTNPRTIILAVVSAENDYANQTILDHCREIDRKGSRTLGIITKLDLMREDTELSWIDLAQNKDLYLKRGWYMLKNRGDRQKYFSLKQRHRDENNFFRKGKYDNLPLTRVGIQSLQGRLNKLVLNRMIKQLPPIKQEIQDILQATNLKLNKLGEVRGTTNDKRICLLEISMSIHKILIYASNGIYDLPFFSSVNMGTAVDAPENICLFRAVIQHTNIGFANDIKIRGHKFAFNIGPGDSQRDAEHGCQAQNDLDEVNNGASKPLPKPKNKTRKEAVQWVKSTLERFRGQELPGTFQSMLVSYLFRELSEPWGELALQHIDKVGQLCRNFIELIIENTTPLDFRARLISMSVDAALTHLLNNAKDELRRILDDKMRQPCTYNQNFTTTTQNTRQRKYRRLNRDVFDKTKQTATPTRTPIVGEKETPQVLTDPGRMEKALDDATRNDADDCPSEEALDIAHAYYEAKMKYFINAITKTVIERHLIEPLPKDILSPIVIGKMTDQEIEFVTAERREITEQRLSLQLDKKKLEKGLEIISEVTGE